VSQVHFPARHFAKLLVRKREFATQLAIRMCEDNAVESAMSFDFTSVANEVEAVLAFKARNADPRSKPCYAKILYTWYTRRGDYRNGEWVESALSSPPKTTLASMTMFLRARKLHDLITDATTFASLAEDQLDSISIAINSLHLVDAKLAWVLLPSVSDTVGRILLRHVLLLIGAGETAFQVFQIHPRVQVPVGEARCGGGLSCRYAE